MQVKKFEASTIAEALKLVKGELGPEAIILSTKNHRKGFGLLSKASVEVTAAISEKALVKKQFTEKMVPSQTKDQIQQLPASKQVEIYNNFADQYLERHRRKKGVLLPPSQMFTPSASPEAMYSPANPPAENLQATKFKQQRTSKETIKAQGPQRYIDILDDQSKSASPTSVGYNRSGKVPQSIVNPLVSSENKVERPLERLVMGNDASIRNAPMTNSFSDLQEEMERLKQMVIELKEEHQAVSDSRIPDVSSEALQVEFQNLLRNGVDKRNAVTLIKQVSFNLTRDELKSSERIVDALALEMMSDIKLEDLLDFKNNKSQRVFALVGPTGVGKTTTIAKIASQALLQHNLKVGLINVDSFKVSAQDQLATYAKILNVPFRHATNAVEVDRAITEFKYLDLVLIDTNGCSQKDTDSLTELRNLLASHSSIQPFLALTATTRDQELYDILTRFKLFKACGIVFSKLDESTTFGCIYNVAVKTALPLAYFTTGQRVPEDIETATRERVASLVLDI